MRIIRENTILLTVICASAIIVALAARYQDSTTNPVRSKISQILPTHLLKIVAESNNSILLDTGEPVNSAPPVSPPKPEDPVSADAYLVGNLETGDIYLYRNTNQQFPIASISKLFTALTAEALMSPTTTITITDEMVAPYGTATGIVAGNSFNMSDLRYPLLLESSNDVADTLARSYGYDAFVQYMNGFVKEIGLTSTRFSDTSGLDAGNVSSAKDLFTFAKYLYSARPDILELSRTKEHDVETIGPAVIVATSTSDGAELATSTEVSTSTSMSDGPLTFTYKNTNVFIDDPHFLGGKTGRTDTAHETMLSLFRYQVAGRSYPIAVIVLHSDFFHRQVDSAILIKMFLDKAGQGAI